MPANDDPHLRPREGAREPLLAGRYRLEAPLGQGGMGIVYRATDVTMMRPVAVKLIRSSEGGALEDEAAERFLREARNTARVQHENIVEVYDLGRTDAGDLFFVMELLAGESLSTRLRRQNKLTPQLVVHVARQVCAALHVAHSAGVVHRDLKPANVMLLRRAGDDAFVKLLDFGVAKSSSADQQTQLTRTGMLVGTIEYMAPEQIMGRPVDARTDIYALGVVLYKMLSGKAPYPDAVIPTLIYAHLNVTPKPLYDTAPEVPMAFDRVVARCMAKNPQHRFGSMMEVSEALSAALSPTALVNLEYDPEGDEADDPYGQSDRTEVARPPSSAPSEALLDDATIRMNKRSSAPPHARTVTGRSVPSPVQAAAPVLGVPRQRTPSFDETALLVHTHGREPLPSSHGHPLPPPQALGPGPGAGWSAPQAGPPRAPPLPPREPAPPVARTAGLAGPAGPAPPPADPVMLPPSAWHRFLVWTGLRSR